MADKPLHSVDFEDTPANWLLWGTLVEAWIEDRNTEAKTWGELEDQMLAKTGPLKDKNLPPMNKVNIGRQNPPGPVPFRERGNRVEIQPYDNHNPSKIIYINVPRRRMKNLDKDWLKNEGMRTYPLPSFYSEMFGHAPLVVVSSNVLEDMRLRRVGEYVINECM